jgi:hypothetical protein
VNLATTIGNLAMAAALGFVFGAMLGRWFMR